VRAFSDPHQAFKDILENIGRIERFTDGLDENSFRENEQTVFAVQYALLVISEAAVRLGEQAQQWAPELPRGSSLASKVGQFSRGAEASPRYAPMKPS
jgi:uncharacterized protein with HEPN domain